MDPKKDDFITYNLMAPDKLEQISTKIFSILKSLMEENIYKVSLYIIPLKNVLYNLRNKNQFI
jgi:hypothetical protein